MHNWIMCAVLCLVQTMLFGNGSPSKMGAPTMMPCPTDISLSSFTELDGRFQFCEGDTGRYEVNWFIGTDPAVIASFTYLWYRDVNANGVYDIITDALITSDEGNDGVLNDLIYTTAMQDGEQIGVVISMAGCMNTRDLNTYVPIRKKACTVESLGCVCVNNATDTTDGTFRDTIRIEGFPNQQWNWELIASEGMLDNNTGLDFFAPVTIFPAVAGDSVILFVIQHRDDIGYSGIFSTGDTEYSVGNGCSYPNPEINLINIYCQDHPAIQMIVTEESGQGSAGVITVNGVQLLGDIYDPSTRDPGTVDTVRYSWIDPAGCIQPASLLVQIDQTPLESIACYDQINVSIGINGIAVITGDMMVPNRACAAAYDVDIMGLPTNVVTCSEIGQIFMVRVTNPGDGSSCMGSILVEDKFGPELTQLIDTLPCTIDPYEVADSILVFAFDNSCTPFVSLTGQRVFYATYCAGQDSLVVTWTATDSYGNKTVKTFVYHWFKPSLAEIDFPANVTQECGSSIDTSITGIPTYEGLPLGYFCTYNVTFTDGVKIKNGCPGKYYIRRTWEVEDWCTWQSRTVVQYLYFEDTQAPIVVCPANLTLASDANYCGLNYILPNIAVAADCSGIKFKKFDILPYASFLNPGQSVQLPPGVHTVVVTVSDSCGNLSSCFYSLTIKDLTSPTVVCQDVNISLNNLGEAILFPNMMLAEAYDNCALAPANTTKIKKMGETDIQFRDSIHLNCSNVGNFLAIIRVFDVAGNFTDCMDTITVIDTIVPTVICSTSFVINLDLNGLDTIQASEITEIIGSSCAGVLSFSFTNPLATPQRIFTCDSLAAEPFDVFVYQNGVLIATCLQVDPIVIDNPSAPCSSMKINVQGKVQTSTGIPLYQVNLQVVG
ncbi:MAG: hypothetical protein ABIV51_08530, partial [Saprospiraceae bacterium]